MDSIITSTPPDDLGMNKEIALDRNPYCSISDVEDYVHRHDLDLGNNSAQDYEYWVNRAIRRAERDIDAWTFTSFHKHRRIEWHDGGGEIGLQLDNYPVMKINELRMYSPGFLSWFTVPINALALDNESGWIAFPATMWSGNAIGGPGMSVIGHRFIPGIRNIYVDYVYGFEVVPDTGFYAGIRNATAKLAAAILLEEAESRQSQGLVSLNVGGQGTQYGRWTMRAQQLRQEARETAMRYTKVLIRGVPT